MNPEPFVLSGRGALAWLLLVVGFAAALVSAFVYAWITVYSPIAGYVSILFVLMLAAGTALPVAFAGRWLKMRSVMQLRIAGVVSGLAAIYFAWAFFAWVMLYKNDATDAPSVWQWIQHPDALWQFANLVAQDGWYTIGHSLKPSGIVLWALWAIEAGIVVGAGFVLAPSRIQGSGFCEACQAWMVAEPTLMVPADEAGVTTSVRRQGLAGLQAVKPPSGGADQWVRLLRQRCPACHEAAVYQVDSVYVTKTEKGTKTIVTPITPLSWQREVEANELQRIEQLLQAADANRHADVAARRTQG